MRTIFLCFLFCFGMLAPAAVRGADEVDPEIAAFVRAMTPQQVHKMVVALETDPFGENAEGARSLLMHYLDDVDIVFCLTPTVVKLSESKKKKLHMPIWAQILFGSGDYVAQYPDKLDDQFAYSLAGWESALRAYEVILSQKPKARMEELDQLLAMRAEGKLGEFVRANVCDED